MRGKLKKLFAAVLAVLLALSFSGCSELTGLDAQALMSPSTRRAWIEIPIRCWTIKSTSVALYPEGVGRTQIVTLDFWRDMPPSLRIKTKMCRASKRRNSSKSAFIGCEKRRMRAFFCR